MNGDGSVVRDYVHVADMADAFARALDACRPGRWTAYNVGAGRRSTIADVVAAVAAVAGRPVPVATARLRRNRRSCWPTPAGSAVSWVAAGAVGPAPDRRRRVRRRGRMIAAAACTNAGLARTNAGLACTNARLACTNAGLAPTPPRVLRRRTRVLRYGT